MSRAGFLCVMLGMVVAGCHRTPFGDGLPSTIDCAGCHGQNGDPTPPRAVDGTSSTDSIGVGAHQSHMRGSSLAGPVACSECHTLPSEANGTDHPDPLGRPAPVIFGILSTQAPASPVWDRGARTCAGTYCHGATLRDTDKRPAPIWTRVDGSQLKCDSCHGYPPPPSHPEGTDCESCHGAVVAAGGIITNPLLHVDGIVEFGP
jgi:predicted CxxxxCH...CXXCH cytochrome family protein